MQSITWEESPRIPISAYNRVRDNVRAAGVFSPRATPEELKKYTPALRRAGLSAEQAEEVARHLRGHAMTSEAIYRHRFVEPAAKSSEIQSLYDVRGIVVAAQKARVPPLALFKQMAALKGCNPKTISGIIAGRSSGDDCLSGRDLEQLREACSADASCRDNQLATMEIATAAENRLVDFFTQRGVSLKTQEELIAEGYTTATPDILFETPIELNGRVVEWLDNKNYTFVPGGFLAKSATKQAHRNLREWGPGGFCYRGICGDSTELAGAHLFDTLKFFSSSDPDI